MAPKSNLKHARTRSLNKRDPEPRHGITKRWNLRPRPPPIHPPRRLPFRPLARSPSSPPTPPEPAPDPTAPQDEHTNLPWCPVVTSKAVGLEHWLAHQAPIHPSNCPPLERPRDRATRVGAADAQQPLLQALAEIPRRRAVSPESVLTATTSSMGITSGLAYRDTLTHNGVRLDYDGSKIPRELRNFLDSVILHPRGPRLLPRAIAKALQVVSSVMNGPEGHIYKFNTTALFPLDYPGVISGGNFLWHQDGLPQNPAYDTELVQPKPDIYCGYPIGPDSQWSTEENSVLGLEATKPIARPGERNAFPFFVLELKSEATGGNIWQAENQAAGGGACCVNAQRWLHQQVHGCEDPSVLNSVAFSVCATQRVINFYVHHYAPAERLHYMSVIKQCWANTDVQQCNDLVKNIMKFGLGARQAKIRRDIRRLSQILHSS